MPFLLPDPSAADSPLEMPNAAPPSTADAACRNGPVGCAGGGAIVGTITLDVGRLDLGRVSSRVSRDVEPSLDVGAGAGVGAAGVGPATLEWVDAASL